jgi:hypothetical protein
MLAAPFGPNRQRKGRPMAFTYKLEHEDGTPVDPPTLDTGAPT